MSSTPSALSYARSQRRTRVCRKCARPSRRSDVRQSMSLMETVDSTAQMQNELMQRMGLVEAVLQSRPVEQLDNGNERNASETKEEGGETEETTEPVKERKKRRRQESTSDQEWQLKEEEKDDGESAQSDSESTVKKIDKEKTEKAKPITKTKDDLRTDSSMELRLKKWAAQVFTAASSAQRLVSQKKCPTVADVSPAIVTLSIVLERLPVPLPAAVSVAQLTEGKFNNLIILTTLDRVECDPQVVSLADRIIRGIELLIGRDPALNGLRKHTSELARIRDKKSNLVKSKTGSPASPPRENGVVWSKWAQRVFELHQVVFGTSRSAHDLSFRRVYSFVDQFRETLQAADVASMEPLVKIKLVNIIQVTIRIFSQRGSSRC